MRSFRPKTSSEIAKYRMIDIAKYPRQRGLGPGVEQIERELNSIPHLNRDIRQDDDRDTTHECRDMRQVKIAAEHLQRIPDALDAFHLLCSGRYALWDLAGPAIIQLAFPHTIAAMTIATLGFSKANIAEMMKMMDAGKIGTLSILASHYFKGTSKGIFEYAEAELGKRTTTRFSSVRNHAKIAAVKLTDGRTVTIESSANLRSCKNIEFMTVYGHPALYDFHIGWMNELLDLKGVHRDR